MVRIENIKIRNKNKIMWFLKGLIAKPFPYTRTLYGPLFLRLSILNNKFGPD